MYWFYDQPYWGYSLAGISYSLYYSYNPRLYTPIEWVGSRDSVSALTLPIKYKIEVDFVRNKVSTWVNDVLYKDNVTISGISSYIWKPVWIGGANWIQNRYNKISYINIRIEYIKLKSER